MDCLRSGSIKDKMKCGIWHHMKKLFLAEFDTSDNTDTWQRFLIKKTSRDFRFCRMPVL